MTFDNASSDCGGTEIFYRRGGDKAPPGHKPKAKARRYQLLISIVD